MRRVYHRLITKGKLVNISTKPLCLPDDPNMFKSHRTTPYVGTITLNHPNMLKWILTLPSTSVIDNSITVNHCWNIDKDCWFTIERPIKEHNWFDIQVLGRTWLLEHVSHHAWSAFHLLHLYKENDTISTEFHPTPEDFGEHIIKYKGRIDKNKREIISRHLGWNSLDF